MISFIIFSFLNHFKKSIKGFSIVNEDCRTKACRNCLSKFTQKTVNHGHLKGRGQALWHSAE